MKIIFIVQSLDFLFSHRLKICIKAKKNGFKVYIAAPYSKENVKKIKGLGFDFYELKFSHNRVNIFSELNLIFQLYKLFSMIRPEILHLITIKPYLYGGIVARVLGIPAVVSAVAGLGMPFSSNMLRYRILRLALYPLFKMAFGHKNQKVIFQNKSDRDILLNWNVIKTDQIEMIRGSGVDLNIFSCTNEPKSHPIVVFAARLLIDKGVGVFVDAAYLLKKKGVEARYWIVGDIDIHNNNSVSEFQLDKWRNDGVVEILGHRKDMHRVFSNSNIVVFPSFYGEGLPKVLLEASACCRPIITTNHPGCRDAINPGETGLLVPIKDVAALAESIAYLISNPLERSKLGKAGRSLAEKEFSDEKVASRHMKIFKDLSL
jgi:glycosyltransferase involved in cell wall biosynthesis